MPKGGDLAMRFAHRKRLNASFLSRCDKHCHCRLDYEELQKRNLKSHVAYHSENCLQDDGPVCNFRQ